MITLLLACGQQKPEAVTCGPGSATWATGGETDAALVYVDADGDGYGNPGVSLSACGVPAGFVRDASDCDDHLSDTHPGGTEVCGGGDEDCDGAVDEADAVGASAWFVDTDGDGYGSDPGPTACAHDGEAEEGGDCDDLDPGVSPDAVEICDGRDEDCDGNVDNSAADASDWYTDSDGDGFGATLVATLCFGPETTVTVTGDCDDEDAEVHPGADERCAAGDEDCDGWTEDEDGAVDGTTWYVDGDLDGYGSDALTLTTCVLPAGFAANASDCDDGDPALHPGVDELCDDIDQDCDGGIDEDAVDASTWYADDDGDGHGSAAVLACDQPAGSVTVADDCDDTDATVLPGATEVCDDGVDQDCDTFERPCPLSTFLELGDVGDVWLGETNDDRAGHSVGWAGDTDGDGLDEVLVGAYREDSVAARAGACYVVRSYGAGESILSAAPVKLTGVADGDHSGSACSGAGDINGDGLGDVLVGAYLAGPSYAGAVYLMTSPLTSGSLGGATATFHGEDPDDQAGNTVRGAGDVNGDGADDILLSGENHAESSAVTGSGAAYLFLGPVTGDLSLGAADARFLGEESVGSTGRGLARGLDIDGDGFADLLIGSPGYDSGRAHLFYGPTAGDYVVSSADADFAGETAGDQLGFSVALLEDTNGDGYGDILLGAGNAAHTASEAGAAYVFSGPLVGSLDVSTADASLYGESVGDRAGYAVDTAGDVDGDHRTDILIGAWAEDSNGTTAGASYVELGPFSGAYSLGDAYAKLVSYTDGVESGRSVAGGGDIDGDGLADLVIGAPDLSVYQNGAGGAFVMRGALFP